MTDRRKVLFFVEGFTDIRFVVGLSEISDLTLCVPASSRISSSGLRERVAASGATRPRGGDSRQPRAIPGPVAAWLWAPRARVRRHRLAGGAARLGQRDSRRTAARSAGHHLHGHRAGRILSLSAQARPDWLGEGADRRGRDPRHDDLQWPAGHTRRGPWVVSARDRGALQRRVPTSGSTTGSTRLSSRRPTPTSAADSV